MVVYRLVKGPCKCWASIVDPVYLLHLTCYMFVLCTERINDDDGDMTVCTCSGNVRGQKPYTKGPACSKCGSGAGWCKNGLCNSKSWFQFNFSILFVCYLTLNLLVDMCDECDDDALFTDSGSWAGPASASRQSCSFR